MKKNGGTQRDPVMRSPLYPSTRLIGNGPHGGLRGAHPARDPYRILAEPHRLAERGIRRTDARGKMSELERATRPKSSAVRTTNVVDLGKLDAARRLVAGAGPLRVRVTA